MPLFSACAGQLIVQHAPHWDSLATAFASQVQALGIELEYGPPLPLAHQAQHVILRATLQLGKHDPVCAHLHLQLGVDAVLDEESLQAACGLLAVHGRARQAYSPLGVPYLSCFCANLSLHGLLAAMLGKLRGAGTDTCFSSIWHTSLLALTQYLAALRAGADEREPPPDSGWHGPPFQSADGIWFELEVLNPEPWHAFCNALDLSPQLAGRSWRAFMLRYAQARSPLPPEFAQRLRTLSASRIADLAQAHGISYCPLQKPAESGGKLGAAWQFHPRPGPVNALPSFSAATELPLQGVRVIESCRRIQGPLAGFLLANLGADVLRVEPPGGDPLRAMPPLLEIKRVPVSARFAALNYNKSMEEVDLKSAEGQARIRSLARHAHVFLHNWGPGKAGEFALDRADLHAVNPDLLYAWAGGWQDPQQSMPGTDFVVQATSGLATLIRHAPGTAGAPGGSLFTMLDLLGGVLSAQGICAALLARQCAARGLMAADAHIGGSDSNLEAAAMVLLACAAHSAPSTAVLHAWTQHDGQRYLLCQSTALVDSAQQSAEQALAGLQAAHQPSALLCTNLAPLTQALLNDQAQLSSCWNFV